MAVQGFFSPDKKRRMAGETENNAAFSVKVKPVTIANNINKYNEQTPSLDYAPDRVGEYIKKAEEKSTYQKKIEERNRIAESFGVDTKTGPTYTERDESKFGGELLRSPFPGVPDRYITTKERISGVTDPRYAKESGFTVTPTKFDKGTAFQIGVQFDQNKYGLTPAKVLGEDIGGMYNFKDPEHGESTKAFVAGMIQNAENAMQTEVRLKKEKEEKEAYEKRLKGSEEWQAAQKKFEEDRKKFLNDRMNQKTTETESPVKDETSTVDKVFGFLDALGKVERVGPQVDQTDYTSDTRKLGTMPSMGISEAGREEAKLNRLQKAKEEGENKNVFQKIGDTVGNVFNKITGTEAAGAGTLQAQGINTSATTNIAQMDNVSPNVQRAREAVEKSVRQQTGMPSNPGSQRQTGVGVSAGNLSRHKTGRSTSRSGISRSTSRGQGGGPSSRSRGGTGTGRSSQGSKSAARGARGSAGSRGRGGTGSGGTSTSRSASKASRSRTGRSRTRCDIRTKIDISPLINSNLVKDNLAEVAYFVQEIRN